MARTERPTTTFQKKYFSVAQANTLIPRLEGLMRRTISLNKAIDLFSTIEIDVCDNDHEDIHRITQLNKQFHKLSYEFYDLIEQIENLGCIIKDLENGIIDFYHKHDRKEVFLCWKLGEQKIKFFHEIDDGYMCRKPLVDLSKHK